jgi:hypothetical protein
MTCLQLAKRCYLKTEDFVYEPLSYYAEFWTGTNKDEKGRGKCLTWSNTCWSIVLKMVV